MALELRGEGDLIEGVELVDGLAQVLVVLFLHVDLVDGLVHGGHVLALHVLQVGHGEGGVARLLQLAHHAGGVQGLLHGGEQALEQHRVLGDHQIDGAVVQLLVVDLGDHVEEVVLLEGHRGVVHHRAGGHIEVTVLLVHEEGLVPQASGLARALHLGGLHAVPVDLQVVHSLLLVVLGVQHGQLGEDSGVGVLQTQTLLHDLDQLLVETSLLVGSHQRLQMVGRGDDVQSAGLSQLVLLGSQTGLVDLLPGADVVGLLRHIHGLAVLAQAHVGGRQLGGVAHVVVQDARSVVHLLVEAAVADHLDLGGVGRADELLELVQAVQLRVGVRQRRVHAGLLHGLAHHQQVAHQALVLAIALRSGDHIHERGRILGADVGLDGLIDLVEVELGLGDLGPHEVVLATLSELHGSVDVLDVLNQHRHGLHLHVRLLVDQEGLLGMTLLQAVRSQLRSIEVVQTLNVVGHALGSGLQTGDDQQVLQRLVRAELSTLQHQVLQQVQQSLGHVRLHEGLHRAADHLAVLALGQRRVHDLLHQLLLMLVLGRQHLSPQVVVHALHQVAGLVLEQTVVVGHTDQVIVASTVGAAVGKEGQERIHLLAELTNDLAVVEGVLQKELLCVLVVGDVDLTDGVVELGVLRTLSQTSLQPGLDHAQAVAGLAHVHKRSDGAHGHHGVQQGLNEVLRSVHIDQLADDHGGLGRSHLLHEGLNVLRQVLLVQVLRHVLDEVEAVAQVNERQRVGQVGVDQEGLHLLGVEGVTLAAHALHLLELVQLGGGLNVLELHVAVGGGVGDGAEEVEQTLRGGELLEQSDQLIHANLLGELLSHLHHDLHVGRVVGHQRAQDLDGLVIGQVADVGHQELGLDHVGVHDHTLNVVDVGVHRQRSLVQSGALAQLSDLRLIEVAEHVGRQDGLGHLGVAAGQVDLQHAGLHIAILREIASLLQHFQQEARALLHKAHGVEGVSNGLHVQRLGVGLGQHLGEALSSLGVLGHHVADQGVVVGGVVLLLAVLQHLLVLVLADEHRHHLLVAVALEVDRHSELHVDRGDHVSQTLGAGDLVLLHPLLDDGGLALLQNDLAELDRLNLVQAANLHNRTNVGHEGRLLAGLRGHLLQLADGVLVTDQRSGRLVGHLRSALDVTLLQEGAELLHEDVISTGQVQARSQLQRHGHVLQRVHHEGNQVRLHQRHLQDGALTSRETNHTSSGHLGGEENRLGRDARAGQQGAGHDVEHVHETHLGHHVGQATLLIDLHRHGEVLRGLSGEGKVHRLDLEAAGLADLHGVVLAGRLGSLLLDEGEQLTLGGLVVHVHEATAVGGKDLRLLVIHRVQLDRSGNAVLSTLANTHQHAPLLVGAHAVVDDLALSEVRMAVHHLSGIALTLNAPVEHAGVGDDGDRLGVDPGPVGHGAVIRKLERAHLRLGVEVEHLESRTLTQSHNLRLGVHDRRLSTHGDARHFIVIGKVDHSQRSALGSLLTNANVLIGLHSHTVEVDASGVHAEGSQLEC